MMFFPPAVRGWLPVTIWQPGGAADRRCGNQTNENYFDGGGEEQEKQMLNW